MGSIIFGRLKNRLITQFAALAGLNLYFLRLQSVCVPALNCYSCPAAVFACPIGTLVNFSALRLFPFITIGILGLTGIIGGRFVCGWVCPFGLIQDGLNKIPSPKLEVPQKLGYTRYLVLILLVFLVPFFFPYSASTFCHFCPTGTLESAIPWRFMGISSGDNIGFSMRLVILLGTIVLTITLSRGFCRLLCPLGAIFSIFNRVSLFRMRLTKPCNNCGICAKECPVEIDPVKQMNAGECIRCLECTKPPHLKFGIK